MMKLLDRAVLRFTVMAILVTAMPCWSTAQDQPSDIQLKGKTKKALNEVIVPAMKVDAGAAFLDAFIPMVNGSTPETLDSIEKFCKQNHGLSAKEYFVDLVLVYAQQGVPLQQLVKNPKLGRYVISELVNRTDEFADSVSKNTIMQDPLDVPEDWQASEQLFWKVHVLSNEFSNIARLIEFGESIAKHSKQNRSNEGQKLIESLDQSKKQLSNIYTGIEERFAELRLKRFEFAHNKLKVATDFETKLTSSMSLEIDGELLLAFLPKDQQSNFGRKILNQEGLRESIQKRLTEGRKLAGEVAVKGNLLRNGLHFWLRGRYGSGPLAYGLLKHPNAMNSQFAMEVLAMPKQRPMPISEYHGNEESYPGYERRHYYTWGLESRKIFEVNTYTASGAYVEGGKTVASRRPFHMRWPCQCDRELTSDNFQVPNTNQIWLYHRRR